MSQWLMLMVYDYDKCQKLKNQFFILECHTDRLTLFFTVDLVSLGQT